MGGYIAPVLFLGEPMMGRTTAVPVRAGGKPNPGTKPDKRLKENKPAKPKPKRSGK